MIDAHAVWAHLTENSGASAGENAAGIQAIEQELAGTALHTQRDVAGNLWVSLPGQSERVVLIGSSLGQATGDAMPLSRLGVVTGLETLRALSRREDGRPPCTVQLVVWAASAGAPMLPPATTAYLELEVEPGTELQANGVPLAVGTAETAAGQPAFHPRLSALCDEAIRELTGSSGTLAASSADRATAVALTGVPTAVMCVQRPAAAALSAMPLPDATRLHLLEAAEAFGRWVEATAHLVAGEEPDLWAREHRVPHN